jgi:hypothetical protein
MCGSGESSHVRSYLSNESPGRDPLNTRYCDPAVHRVSQFPVLRTEMLEPGIERLDLGLEEAILTK